MNGDIAVQISTATVIQKETDREGQSVGVPSTLSESKFKETHRAHLVIHRQDWKKE